MTSPLRIAMLGMIPGNGHPYSWSAIINGYDPVEMAACPYPAIPRYLGAQSEPLGISGACVTHLWTDNPKEAAHVAAATRIPYVVKKPQDVIGEVDAVIISTDDGTDHVRRARPFVEAGLPVFVDKPLASTQAELAQFAEWHRSGARILSSSGMRYAPELEALKGQDWLWITSVACKTWERYGIHALEPVYTLLGPGFVEVRNEARPGSDIVHCHHRSGTQITIAAIYEASGSLGVIHAYGKEGARTIHMRDHYQAFRNQLRSAVSWASSGVEPYPFSQTIEMMAVIIAGQKSRDLGGASVSIESILNDIPYEK